MRYKLNTKVQKINPELPEKSSSFSGVLVIEPDNSDLVLKKGSIYAVFSISGSEFDTQLISKIIGDVLYSSYYQSENISPIQSLEKAISEVKDSVTKINPGAMQLHETQVEFSIVAGALWGNVLYRVLYGKGESYLVREGEIKPISSVSEGNFSVASGIVKNDDVVMLATKEFAAEYTPEKLMTTSLSHQDLSLSSSCIILKFVLDTSFTEREVVEFKIKPKKQTILFEKIASVFKFKSIRKPKNEAPKLNIKIKPKRTRKLFFSKTTLVIGVSTLLALSLLYTYNNKNIKNSRSINATALKQDTSDDAKVLDISTAREASESFPETAGFRVFYDIKITNSAADPTSIAVVDNNLAVADKTSGMIYVSDLATPKFEAESVAYSGISSLIGIGTKLNFSDSKGYKIYDIAKSLLTQSYDLPDSGLTSSYLGYIYSLSGDKINKYTKDGEVLTKSLWAESADFVNASGMDVAMSIYVLKEDGTLVSYTRGVQDDFKVTGLEIPFSKPDQVVVNIDFDNIYVADKGNKRVVVLNKKGEVVKKIQPVNGAVWNDIRGIAITGDESRLYVLDQTKVYEVAL